MTSIFILVIDYMIRFLYVSVTNNLSFFFLNKYGIIYLFSHHQSKQHGILVNDC